MVEKLLLVLKKMLQKSGFRLLPKRGKGSHTYWVHPLMQNPIVLAGKDSKDAQPYQEKDVMTALKELEKLKQEGE